MTVPHTSGCVVADRLGSLSVADGGLWAYLEGLRRDRGWTQNELARRAGKDRQVFVRIRNGGNADHETIFALAEVLGVAPAELLRLQGYPVEKLGVVSESLEPRELTRDELVDEVRLKLSHDELLGLVRERMPDPPPDDDAVLRAHEPLPPYTRGASEPTGRREPDGESADAVSPSDGA